MNYDSEVWCITTHRETKDKCKKKNNEGSGPFQTLIHKIPRKKIKKFYFQKIML